MRKILILGGTGMLGHVCKLVLESANLFDVVSTCRANKSGYIEFDALSHSPTELVNEIKPDWIINCIGVTKSQIDETSVKSLSQAISINAVFPSKLSQATSRPIIQIATDCVYSGDDGNYLETDLHDCTDVYGKTKSLGEIPVKNLLHLRTSIIGPELGKSHQILEWFRNQDVNAEINGFTDHLWNGITTHHFAKLVLGIISNDFQNASKIHVIPSDSIKKSDLLHEFSRAYNRRDIKINNVLSGRAINRTLACVNPDLNQVLWNMAGYQHIPSIAQRVNEQAQIIP